MALHSDEVVRLGHELGAFSEVFFEEFAKQLPLAAAEQGARLDGKFEPSFVQAWIWSFVEVAVVCVGFNLLSQQLGLLGQGLVQYIPQKGAGLSGVAGFLVVDVDDIDFTFAAHFFEGLCQFCGVAVRKISCLSERVEVDGFRDVPAFF